MLKPDRTAELRRLLARRAAVPDPHRRPRLNAQGTTDRDIATLVRRGDWSTVSPGRYVASSTQQQLSRRGRHLALVAGLMADLAPDSVVSHISAAALIGIPLWGVRLDRLHVSRPRAGGAKPSRWLRPHAARGPIPTVVIDGFPVTAPARTVVDCARILPFEQGVVIADAALHEEIVAASDLHEELQAAAGCTGVGRARAVVDFADGRSESVGESRSRVLLATAPLPTMELQYAIHDEHGLFVARVDFAIPEIRVAGEFDGKVKYGRLLRPGESAGDAVFNEKKREDAVRDIDWQMVRWVWGEIDTPPVVIDRWERAIRRATRNRQGA